jgi:long-subunit acyl-CoA synthetase (AMP-forming)
LLSYNSMQHNKQGTVGKVADGINLRFGDDEEILVKGDALMKGYAHTDGKCDNARDSDGLFHTGDIGELDNEGFLIIKGRLKSRFKNSKGAFFSPEIIEHELRLSALFQNVFVFGENQNFLSAVFVLKEGSNGVSTKETIVRDYLNGFNKDRHNEQKIALFYIAPDDFGQQYFSSSFKLRRDLLADSCKNYKFIAIDEA